QVVYNFLHKTNLRLTASVSAARRRPRRDASANSSTLPVNLSVHPERPDQITYLLNVVVHYPVNSGDCRVGSVWLYASRPAALNHSMLKLPFGRQASDVFIGMRGHKSQNIFE